MSRPHSSAPRSPQPFVVALAAWAVPGLGYGLLGDWVRAITVGVAIVFLFVAGLLIGGVRVVEVPYYDNAGNRLLPTYDSRGNLVKDVRLIDEIRSKPWSIAQVMAGPLGIGSAYASNRAATPPKDENGNIVGDAPGVESHARVNEIGVLYTAVAGMLNLLCIIDAAHRAGKMLEDAK